ncbi:hypothetical protein ACFCT7_01590 [Fulvivirgaceae bacterium LMO-SS25]
MNSSEILILDKLDTLQYERIMREVISTSLLSFPFTYQQVELQQIKIKIEKLIKGKFAEALFKYFCEANKFSIDFDACETGYHKPKKRDFIFENIEFDLINNYLYHPNQLLSAKDYLELPALIPNKHKYDFWAQRDHCKLTKSKHAGFIFTFLKNADSFERRNQFFEFDVSIAQVKFLQELRQSYGNTKVPNKPFDEVFFWEEFLNRGGPFEFSFNHKPILVIGPVASTNQWPLFNDLGNKPHTFGQQVLKTVISNMACKWRELPSFYAILPPLQNELNYASFLTA